MLNRALDRYRIEFLLLLVVSIWGTNFVIMKLVLQVMHPHVMNVFRILSSGLVLTALHARRQKSLDQSFFEPLRLYPREIITIGIVGWWMYQIAFIVGLDNTTAGTAAIIMASLPLWTALLSVFFRLEKLSIIGWIGIAVTMIGTAIVMLFGVNKVEVGSTFLYGNAIMLLAAILWGLNTVLTQKLVDRVTPVGITLLALLVSIPLLLIVSLPYWGTVHWPEITYLVWIAIFFSGALSTGIAIVMWNYAVKQVGASHTAAFQNLVPIVALVTSFLILGEQIVIGQIVGGLATIAGLVIMRSGRISERTQRQHTHS